MSLLKFELNMSNGFLINPSLALSRTNNDGEGFLGGATFGDVRFVLNPTILSMDSMKYDVFDRDSYTSRVTDISYELDRDVTLSHIKTLCDDKPSEYLYKLLLNNEASFKGIFNNPNVSTLSETIRQLKNEPLFSYLFMKNTSDTSNAISNKHHETLTLSKETTLRDIHMFADNSHVAFDERFEVFLYNLLNEACLSRGMVLDGDYVKEEQYVLMRDLAEASCECLGSTSLGDELADIDDKTKMFTLPSVLKRLACTTRYESIEDALVDESRISSLLSLPSQESTSLNTPTYVIDAERRVNSLVDYTSIDIASFMHAFHCFSAEDLKTKYEKVFKGGTDFDELHEDLAKIINHYTTSHVPYFEVKFNTPINLLDKGIIDHIVVPDDLVANVKDILSQHGLEIDVVTHNRKRRSIMEATVESGERDINLSNYYLPNYKLKPEIKSELNRDRPIKSVPSKIKR